MNAVTDRAPVQQVAEKSSIQVGVTAANESNEEGEEVKRVC